MRRRRTIAQLDFEAHAPISNSCCPIERKGRRIGTQTKRNEKDQLLDNSNLHLILSLSLSKALVKLN